MTPVTDVWTWPARVGILLGSGLFLALLVPILVVQVRRYGAVNLVRLLGAAALAVYGTALLAYTLLPLPSGDLAAWCAGHGYAGAQLRPLQILDDVRERTAGMPLTAAVRDVSVLQGVLNVVLFVPWGVLVRRYLGWGLLATSLSALAASVLVETVQYTGILGIIPCSYRLADVDDLLTNTLGGVLGALVAPWVLRWMPRARALAQERGRPRPVTVWRRWLGMLVDAVALGVAVVVLTTVWGVAGYVLTGRVPADTWLLWAGTSALAWVLVFVLPLAAGAGESLGQRVVWLAPTAADGGRLTASARLRRGLSGGALWGLLQVLGDAADMLDAGGLGWARGLGSLLALVVVVAVPLTADRGGLSGRVTPYRLVDARSLEPHR